MTMMDADTARAADERPPQEGPLAGLEIEIDPQRIGVESAVRRLGKQLGILRLDALSTILCCTRELLRFHSLLWPSRPTQALECVRNPFCMA
jgi:hypothetical protein